MRKYILLLLLILASCGKNFEEGWEVLTIKEGQHRSTPWQLKYEHHEDLSYQWRFDDSARYDHGDNDQYDWNKLTGLSYSLLNSHYNSAMVSWRYNLDRKTIELSAYYHKSKIVIRRQPLLEVNVHDTFYTEIIPNTLDSTIIVRVSTAATTAEDTLKYNISLDQDSREIWPWFGGNKEAPLDITLQRKPL
jgi:hypothetical protein